MYWTTENEYENEKTLKDENNLDEGDCNTDADIVSLILDEIITDLTVSYDSKKRYLTTQKIDAVLTTQENRKSYVISGF